METSGVRRSFGSVALSLALCAAVGCGDDQVTQPIQVTVETLLTGLEYPHGLWPTADGIYLTETAGRSTSFGGAIRLSRYDQASDELMTLVDGPVNPHAVVVLPDGRILLSGWQRSIPGDSGGVSAVDPGSLSETPVTVLEIAISDMHLDANGDIYVIGASDDPNAPSLYRLPADDYANSMVVARGLGRATALTRVASDLFYSDIEGIRHLDSSGTITPVREVAGVSSLTSDGRNLYYTDIRAGQIARIDLETMALDTIATGLASPTAVRYEPSTSRLFVLEGGTAGNEFKDGRLQAISGLERQP